MNAAQLVLLILLLVLVFGGLPVFGMHQYGYWPSSFVLILVCVLLVLALTGRI